MKMRNPCARCTTGRAIATCNGCEAMFCIIHFNEHRAELTRVMDTITLEHDSLRHDLYEETVEHPLLSRINAWEEESMKIIKTVADRARTKLHQILTEKKHDVISLLENFTAELQVRRDSEDFTENDLRKWTEKLKSFRDTFDDCSNIILEDDKNSQSVIHLIKISEQRPGRSSSLVQSIERSSSSLCQLPTDSTEKFDKIDCEVSLSDDELVATYRSKFNVFSSRYVYGVNRYSSGNHSVHLSIERKADTPLFFGIITASKKYDQSYIGANNSSVYGWYNMESFVINGKAQKYTDENLFRTGDQVILLLNCNEAQIGFHHRTTKRLFQIPINLDKCPFPWKLIFSLPTVHDSIRIIHE